VTAVVANDNAGEVMSAEQTAVFLGVERKTVYEYANRGIIPHQRLGKRLLFGRQALVAWLGACRGARVGKG
jgi:excisionase family DNA binding protein